MEFRQPHDIDIDINIDLKSSALNDTDDDDNDGDGDNSYSVSRPWNAYHEADHRGIPVCCLKHLIYLKVDFHLFNYI